MKNSLLITMLMLFALAHAQRQNENWYFSFSSGLNFAGEDPALMNDSQLYTNEGSSSVSDAQGNLLFYTNGEVVYNGSHQIMENGEDLAGSFSSSQSLVVQKPGSATVYYIFTVGSSDEPNIMAYSEVDMTLGNGLGAITSFKNVELLSGSTEHLVSTYHNNGRDIWVLTNDKNGLFTAFLITEDGVTATPVTSPGLAFDSDSQFSEIGLFKVSPDGSKLALTQYSEGFSVYNFDNTTGVLGSEIFSIAGGLIWYGVEFSPSGRFVYFSKDDTAEIVQYDLEAANVTGSATEVLNIDFMNGGALQIAPNGKIYLAHHSFSKLSVIHAPDMPGLSCNVEAQAVDLGIRRVFIGLPSFVLVPVELAIIAANTCEGELVAFDFESSLDFDSISWDFGDGSGSSELRPIHTYTAPGSYTVTLTGHLPGMNRVVQTEITVLPKPEAGLEASYELCHGNVLALTAPISNAAYQWSTGSTSPNVEITSGGNYSLTITPGNGCETIHNFVVNEIDCTEIPRGISPNGDGMNDNFDLANMTVNKLTIFNRYGLEVYSVNDYSNQWAGQAEDGKELPDGTYYYSIQNPLKNYTGWVYINREIN